MAKKVRCTYCTKKIGVGIYCYVSSDGSKWHRDCLARTYVETADGIRNGLYSSIVARFEREVNYD